jgi:hypothetical protein
MTRKKDLKKRVRERQARTQECYTTALAQVLAHRPAEPDELLLEMIDLSAEAARLGINCQAWAWPELTKHVDGAAVLGQLKQALIATRDDRRAALFRAVVLDGEHPMVDAGWMRQSFADLQRYAAQVQAGIGGADERGSMFAFHADGRRGGIMVLCRLVLPPKSLLEIFQPSELEKWRHRYTRVQIGTAATTLVPITSGSVRRDPVDLQAWLRALAGH